MHPVVMVAAGALITLAGAGLELCASREPSILLADVLVERGKITLAFGSGIFVAGLILTLSQFAVQLVGG